MFLIGELTKALFQDDFTYAADDVSSQIFFIDNYRRFISLGQFAKNEKCDFL